MDRGTRGGEAGTGRSSRSRGRRGPRVSGSGQAMDHSSRAESQTRSSGAAVSEPEAQTGSQAVGGKL
eukprot:12854485-Alexandrium_andersonii.AAC.1